MAAFVSFAIFVVKSLSRRSYAPQSVDYQLKIVYLHIARFDTTHKSLAYAFGLPSDR